MLKIRANFGTERKDKIEWNLYCQQDKVQRIIYFSNFFLFQRKVCCNFPPLIDTTNGMYEIIFFIVVIKRFSLLWIQTFNLIKFQVCHLLRMNNEKPIYLFQGQYSIFYSISPFRKNCQLILYIPLDGGIFHAMIINKKNN